MLQNARVRRCSKSGITYMDLCLHVLEIAVRRSCSAGFSMQALSYLSPQALLRAVFSQQQPHSSLESDGDDRVASFKRYIASKEARGGVEAVPEFPAGATWFNSPPLKLSRSAQSF